MLRNFCNSKPSQAMRPRAIAIVAALGALLLTNACTVEGPPITAQAKADTGTPGDTEQLFPSDIQDSSAGDQAVTELPTTLDQSTGPETTTPDVVVTCPGGAGCACSQNAECETGLCIEGAEQNGSLHCAQKCTSTCPDGYTCGAVVGSGGDITNVCVAKTGHLCDPCMASKDCETTGITGAACIDMGGAGKFCGTPCQKTADCPSQYACTAVTTSEGISTQQCTRLATDGGSGPGACLCSPSAASKQLTTTCSKAAFDDKGLLIGKCNGTRICTNLGLSPCTAPTATIEVCDGADNDCDGLTDEPGPGVCNDNLPCTYDNCVVNVCQHPPMTGACDDGNACTAGEECSDGKCKGTAVVCDDGNPCTQDACEPQFGCTMMPSDGANCSDGDACTQGDVCKSAMCKSGKAQFCDDNKPCTTDSCNPTSGCVYADNTLPCSDDDVCTATDACAGGVCVPGSPLACNDGNPCTDDSCDTKTGCVSLANTASCTDNNVCTLGDACASGSCTPGNPKICNDNSVCTLDYCDPKLGCQVQDLADTACSDGDVCTDGDTCSAGKCTPGLAKSCEDGNLCTDDSCVTGEGCVSTANTAKCSDNSVCTLGDMCQGGLCYPGKQVSCEDGDPCTDAGCDPIEGCDQKQNTASCNDGSLCTFGDVCNKGACAGQAVVCDDGNPCTDDSCNPKTGCVFAANTAPCSDGNDCTSGDVCFAKVCTPKALKDCGDGNPCTDNACDPVQGCVASNNAAVCDDGDACTFGDACSGGTCKAGKGCDGNATCATSGAGKACACKAGYKGDGFTCADIDECAAGTFTCATNMKCDNTIGSYTCSCKTDFANCDGLAGNGCEVALKTDDSHCGVCTKACQGLESCQAGTCTADTSKCASGTGYSATLVGNTCYWEFTTVGNINWTAPATATYELLSVGGGGGGGSGGYHNGSGGAASGGVAYSAGTKLDKGVTYVITVGGGGAPLAVVAGTGSTYYGRSDTGGASAIKGGAVSLSAVGGQGGDGGYSGSGLTLQGVAAQNGASGGNPTAVYSTGGNGTAGGTTVVATALAANVSDVKAGAGGIGGTWGTALGNSGATGMGWGAGGGGAGGSCSNPTGEGGGGGGGGLVSSFAGANTTIAGQGATGPQSTAHGNVKGVAGVQGYARIKL